MPIGKLPLITVDDPLATYSQPMQQRFAALLRAPDMNAELDIATTEHVQLWQYLESPSHEPEQTLRLHLTQLLPHLKPVAHLFTPAEIEPWLNHVGIIPHAVLAPLATVLNIIHDILPWASLEPRVLGPLERLRTYYETAYQTLTSGTQDARIQCLTWKAQLSIPHVGHHLIPVQAARSLLCRDESGKSVKKNKEGNHAVLFRDGLVFKPNPLPEDKTDPIEPGMEHALVAWYQLLANSDESAATTEIIKLRQVPFTCEISLEPTEEAAKHPNPNPPVITLDGGVVQCGLMIRGVLLQDFLLIQETMAHWLACLGQNNLERSLPELLRGTQAIAMNPFHETETLLKTLYDLSAAQPPAQQLDDTKRMQKSQGFLTETAHYVERKGGLPSLYWVFSWCQRYPALMQGQTVADMISWPDTFRRVADICPGIHPAAQIDFSLNWSQRLNPDNITAILLGTLLTYPTDGKGDNYMVTFHPGKAGEAPQDLKIIGIDNDRALLSDDGPLQGISCRPGLGKQAKPVYWPDLNCAFLVLPGLLSIPASPVILKHFLNKTPLEWIEIWLTSLLYKTQQWRVWQALAILMPDDIDNQGNKRLDIPVQLPPSLIDGLMMRLEKIQRIATMTTAPLPLKQLFMALEPVLASYYESLANRFPHRPLKTHEYIHNAPKRDAEIGATLGEQLHAPLPPLAAALHPGVPANATLETLLATYPLQSWQTKQDKEPVVSIEPLAQHVAESQQAIFVVAEFDEAHIKQTVLKLEALGQLGAEEVNMRQGQFPTTLEPMLLIRAIYQAIIATCPGALRLLLLVRERQLATNGQSDNLRNLQDLQDSEGRNLWHIFFRYLDLKKENPTATEHITTLLAQAVPYDVNNRNNEGRLPIFSLVRRICIVPKSAELVLSRLVGLGIDFSLTERAGNRDETPLDCAMQCWLDRPNKANLDSVVILLRYGAGRAVTAGLAQAFFDKLTKQPGAEAVMQTLLQQLQQQNRVFAWQQALNTLTAPLEIGQVPKDAWLIEGVKSGKRYLHADIAHRVKQTQEPVLRPTSTSAVKTDRRPTNPTPGPVSSTVNPLPFTNPSPITATASTKGKFKSLFKKKSSNKTSDKDKAAQNNPSSPSMLPTFSSASPSNTQLMSPAQEEQYGRHEVLPIEFQGARMHMKILPELPGLEYAVGSLYRHFFDYGLPETELFRFPEIIKGRALAVLFSQTILGENLHDVLKSNDAAAKLSQLDMGRFTELFIMHLLTNPEDGKPDNYQLVSFINTQGQERYAIIPIDNDHAFVDAFRIELDKNKGPMRILQIKTIIYCLDAMHWPLDSAVIQKFVNLSIAQKLTAWLNELVQAEQGFNQLFGNKKERKQLLQNGTHPVVIGVPFAPKKIAVLYDKAKRLQHIFQKHLTQQWQQQGQQPGQTPNQPMLSGLEVLKKFEPALGYYYANAFNEAQTSQARFFYLAKDFYVTDARGQQQTLMSGINLLSTQNISESGMLGQDERYSPAQALNELERVQTEYNQLETVRRAVQAGTIKALDALLLDKNKQKVILGLDFAKLDMKAQDALWNYLTNKKTAVAFDKLKIRGRREQPIHTLNDDILKKLLEQSPHLRELHLNYCPQITEASLGKLDELCPSLILVHLEQLPKLTRLDKRKKRMAGMREGVNSPLALESLQGLELIDCASLTIVDIASPGLGELSILNAPSLTNCRTQSKQLNRLNMTGCQALPHTAWYELTLPEAHLTLDTVLIQNESKDKHLYAELVSVCPVMLGINWAVYPDIILPATMKEAVTPIEPRTGIYRCLTTSEKSILLNAVTSALAKINGLVQQTKQPNLRAKLLLIALTDEHSETRAAALEALKKLTTETQAIIRALQHASKNSNSDVRAAAALVKLEQANPENIQLLIAAVKEVVKIDTFGMEMADPYLLVRADAVEALGDLAKNNPQINALLQPLLQNKDKKVQIATAHAMAKRGELTEEILQILLSALTDYKEDYDRLVAHTFVKLGQAQPSISQFLQTTLDASHSDIRKATTIADILVEIGHETPAIIQTLLIALRDPDKAVCRIAARALGKLGRKNTAVLNALMTALGNAENNVRVGAMIALREHGEAPLQTFQIALQDPDDYIRVIAAGGLLQLTETNPVAIQVLERGLRHSDISIRAAAIKGLGKLKEAGPEIIQLVMSFLDDKHETVRATAAQTLGVLAHNFQTRVLARAEDMTEIITVVEILRRKHLPVVNNVLKSEVNAPSVVVGNSPTFFANRNDDPMVGLRRGGQPSAREIRSELPQDAASLHVLNNPTQYHEEEHSVKRMGRN